jgi:hypothetical protein
LKFEKAKAFEKPGYHITASSRVETGRFQARGYNNWIQLVQPPPHGRYTRNSFFTTPPFPAAAATTA